MNYKVYLFAALAVIAAGLSVSCEKEKEPESPVLFDNAVKVEAISLDQASLTFTDKKQSALLTATITPDNASDKRVLWKSSDESVVKVSNGTVETVDFGKAVITATAYAGGFTTSCSVAVVKEEMDAQAVDLLGSKYKIYFSNVNFGAENPQDFGSFFAFGELDPKSDYSQDSYMVPLAGWCGVADKDSLANIEYITPANDTLANVICTSKYDVVAAKWGNGWRMPTAAEINLIVNAMDWTWTSVEGVYGWEVKNPNSGKSIFLPVAGYHDGETHAHPGAKGRYWTGNRATDPLYAWSLNFNSERSSVSLEQSSRYLGFVIRPVQDHK